MDSKYLAYFQYEILMGIKENVAKGNLHLSVVMPPGSGKTMLSVILGKEILCARGRVLFLVANKLSAKYMQEHCLDSDFESFGVITSREFLKDISVVKDYASIIIDGVTDTERYLISNCGVDFSDKVVISFVTPLQETERMFN